MSFYNLYEKEKMGSWCLCFWEVRAVGIERGLKVETKSLSRTMPRKELSENSERKNAYEDSVRHTNVLG